MEKKRQPNMQNPQKNCIGGLPAAILRNPLISIGAMSIPAVTVKPKSWKLLFKSGMPEFDGKSMKNVKISQKVAKEAKRIIFTEAEAQSNHNAKNIREKALITNSGSANSFEKPSSVVGAVGISELKPTPPIPSTPNLISHGTIGSNEMNPERIKRPSLSPKCPPKLEAERDSHDDGDFVGSQLSFAQTQFYDGNINSADELYCQLIQKMMNTVKISCSVVAQYSCEILNEIIRGFNEFSSIPNKSSIQTDQSQFCRTPDYKRRTFGANISYFVLKLYFSGLCKKQKNIIQPQNLLPILNLVCDFFKCSISFIKEYDMSFVCESIYYTRLQDCLKLLSSIVKSEIESFTEELVIRIVSVSTQIFRSLHTFPIHALSITILLDIYRTKSDNRTQLFNEVLHLFDTFNNREAGFSKIVSGGLKIHCFTYLVLRCIQIKSSDKSDTLTQTSSLPIPQLDLEIQYFRDISRKLNQNVNMIVEHLLLTFTASERNNCDGGPNITSQDQSFVSEFVSDLIQIRFEPEFSSARKILLALKNSMCEFAKNMIHSDHSISSNLVSVLTIITNVSFCDINENCEISLQFSSQKMFEEQINSAKILLPDHVPFLIISNHLYSSTNASDTDSEIDGDVLFSMWLKDEGLLSDFPIENGRRNHQEIDNALISIINLYKHYKTRSLMRFFNSPVSRTEALQAYRYKLFKMNSPCSLETDIKFISSFSCHKSPVVRSKCLKLITPILANNTRLLHEKWLKESVEARILDQSVMVRESTVELIGQSLMNDCTLHDIYMPLLLERVMDTGLVVRKRILRFLSEFIIEKDREMMNKDIKLNGIALKNSKNLSSIVNVYKKFLPRITDDPSIASIIIDTFSQLWFTNSSNNHKTSKNGRFPNPFSHCNKNESYFNSKLDIITYLLMQDEETVSVAPNQLGIFEDLLQSLLNQIKSKFEEKHAADSFKDDCLRWSLVNLTTIKNSFYCVPSSPSSSSIQTSPGSNTQNLVAHLRTFKIFGMYVWDDLCGEIGFFIQFLHDHIRKSSRGDPKMLRILCQILRNLLSSKLLKHHITDSMIASVEKILMELVIKQTSSIMTESLHTLYVIISTISKNYALVGDCFDKYFGYLMRELPKYSQTDSPTSSVRATISRCIVTVGLLFKHFSLSELRKRSLNCNDTLTQEQYLVTAEQITSILVSYTEIGPTEISSKALKALGFIVNKYPEFVLKGCLDKLFSSILTSKSLSTSSDGLKCWGVKERYMVVEIFRNLLDSEYNRDKNINMDGSPSQSTIQELKISSKTSHCNGNDHESVNIIENGVSYCDHSQSGSESEVIDELQKNNGDIKDIVDKRSSKISEAVQKFLSVIITCYITSEISLRSIISSFVFLVVRLGLIHPLYCVPILVCIESDSECEKVPDQALAEIKTIGKRHLAILCSYSLSGIKLSRELHEILLCQDDKNDPSNLSCKTLRGFDFRKKSTNVDIPAGFSKSNEIQTSAVNTLKSHIVAKHQRLYSVISHSKSHRRQFLLTLLNCLFQPESDFGFKLYVADNLATFNYQVLDEILFLIYHINLTLVSTATVNLEVLKALSSVDRSTVAIINASMTVLLQILLKRHIIQLYNISETKYESYMPSLPHPFHNQSVTHCPEYYTKISNSQHKNNLDMDNIIRENDTYPWSLSPIFSYFLHNYDFFISNHQNISELISTIEGLLYESSVRADSFEEKFNIEDQCFDQTCLSSTSGDSKQIYRNCNGKSSPEYRRYYGTRRYSNSSTSGESFDSDDLLGRKRRSPDDYALMKS